MTDNAGDSARVTQPDEQMRYATWLSWGARSGLLVLILSFAAYVLGWLPSLVSPERLPLLWGLPVDQYLLQSGAPTGWAWVMQIGRGDVAAISGIVILAGCSVPALLALVPSLLRRGDRSLAVLCIAEVVVILVAATGWLTGAH